ncbi:MAG: DNA primase family protein [Candidatus Methylumidiphilus sp.]
MNSVEKEGPVGASPPSQANGSVKEKQGNTTMERQERQAESNVTPFPAIPKRTRPEVDMTVFTKSGGHLSKEIYLVNGRVEKDGSKCRMSDGVAARAVLGGKSGRPSSGLAGLIESLKRNQAIALGRLGEGIGSSVAIATKRRADPNSDTCVARSADNIGYSPGKPAFMLLDTDTKGAPPTVRGKLAEVGIEAMVAEVLPEITSTDRVFRASTSAGLFVKATEEPIGDAGGSHLYLLVKDGTDIERALKVLAQRLWLAGHGWIALARDGRMLPRQPVDTTVAGPERLVFEGGPILGADLGQDEEARRPRPTAGTAMETRVALPDLTKKERKDYDALVAAAEKAAEPEAAQVRTAYIEAEAEKLVKAGATPEAARATIEARSRGDLAGTDIIELADRTVAIVAEILTDPTKYHGKACADPVEGPGYGRSTAIIYCNQPEPIIRSFAHGEAIYRLHAGEAPKAKDIFSETTPYQTALTILTRDFTTDGHRAIHYHNSSWRRWSGKHYPDIEDGEIRQSLYRCLDNSLARIRVGDQTSIAPFNPTPAKVNCVIDALKAETHTSKEVIMPSWLDGTSIAPTELVPCQNGLLHLQTLKLYPHSPTYFNANVLSFDYDPCTREPMEWLKFLGQIMPDDAEAISCLQEMFGLLLTSETKYQKIFMVVGPKRCGKGTIARVLVSLLGRDNTCSPTLASLSEHFGMTPLIGKQLATISDARLDAKSNKAVILERLLSVSGEDDLTIDRKHITAWNGRLSARFLILTNEVPTLPDMSGAFAGRLVVWELKESFFGREDLGLTEKLIAELPGILNWSIEGWQRLRKRGYFVPPSSSAQIQKDVEDLSCSILPFVESLCVIGKSEMVSTDVIYAEYQDWCRAEGIDRPRTKTWLGRDLRTHDRSLKKRRIEGTDYYVGISVRGKDKNGALLGGVKRKF